MLGIKLGPFYIVLIFLQTKIILSIFFLMKTISIFYNYIRSRSWLRDFKSPVFETEQTQ